MLITDYTFSLSILATDDILKQSTKQIYIQISTRIDTLIEPLSICNYYLIKLVHYKHGVYVRISLSRYASSHFRYPLASFTSIIFSMYAILEHICCISMIGEKVWQIAYGQTLITAVVCERMTATMIMMMMGIMRCF